MRPWNPGFGLYLAFHSSTLLLALASPGAAQVGELSVEGEVGVAVFFGNTSQSTITARVAAERVDSRRELAVDGLFSYGEATDTAGNDFVNKRLWAVGLSFTHAPLAAWSPFVFGRLESSYEKRIDLRYNLETGIRHTLVRDARSQIDVSLALLAERTSSTAGVTEPELLARWSVRLRARRELLEDRVSVGSETFCRPSLGGPGEFTLATTNTVAVQLNDRVSLRLTFLDNYDSEASGRGARSNNDGQLLFGVLSSL